MGISFFFSAPLIGAVLRLIEETSNIGTSIMGFSKFDIHQPRVLLSIE